MRPALLLLLLLLLTACSNLPSPVKATGDTYDDADWATVLKEFVDDRGRVDYRSLRERRAPLDRYVALLAVVGPTTRPGQFTTTNDRLAYWINAYNALVMFQVIERWPLKSVGDHKKKFFYFTRFEVDGRNLSLYAIENDIVRGFGEPRIHFALNCASLGCPALPREPFRAAALEAQLARETARFLGARPNAAREGEALVLSRILDWYSGDFEPDPGAWVAQRVPRLAGYSSVRYRDYDWTLNGR